MAAWFLGTLARAEADMIGARKPSAHPVPARVVDRIWSRIEVGSEKDCWPFRLSVGSHGYGQIGWAIGGGRSSMTTAHRVAWQAMFGDIPPGMTVDHLCKNRICCNPSHLRLLTNRENAADNRQAKRGPGRMSYKEEPC